MAERQTEEEVKGFSSGSDAEMVCTPCADEGMTESAAKYCPVCKEFLCTTCIKCHRKFAATREHVLIERDAAQTDMTPKTRNEFCPLHPSHEITRYCQNHDMVYCALCIATDHRSCKAVYTITEVSLSQPANVHTLLKDIEQCELNLENTEQTKKNKIIEIDNNITKFTREIENTRTQLVEKINGLSDKAMKELNIKGTEVKQGLVQDIGLLQGMGAELKSTKQNVVACKNFDVDQRFIRVKHGRKIINSVKQLEKDMGSRGNDNLSCEKHTSFIDLILKRESLLTIERIQNIAKSYNIKTIQSVAVGSKVFVSDVCPLRDGTLILADHRNKKFKFLDKHNNITYSYCLSSCPTGICYMEQDEVAVKLSDNQLMIFNVSDKSVVRKFNLHDGVYLGLAYRNGMFWVTRNDGLDIYEQSGKFVKNVKHVNTKGCNQHIAVSNGSCKLFIAATEQGVLCYEPLRDIFTNVVINHELQVPRGVCTTPDGTLFVSDESSNNILMLKEDGTFIGRLLSSETCIDKPVAVKYDEINHRLIVSSDNSDSIQVISFA